MIKLISSIFGGRAAREPSASGISAFSFHPSSLSASALLLISALSFQPSALALDISNSTNTPATNSATIYADITNVTATTTATCYYGTTDGGTTTAYWAYSLAAAAITNDGQVEITATNLAAATWHYYRWQAADGSTNATAWASASSNFTTLSSPPTNYPAPSTGVTVIADADTGALLSPLNFFTGSGVPDSDDIAGLQASIGTNQTNLASHIDDTANPHTVTPGQIGALAGSSNLSDVADAAVARSNLAAAAQSDLEAIISPTNQIITVDGTAYTITNSPATAADVLTFDPATTTACFAAQGGYDDTIPYQAFTSILTPDDGGTCTVTYASGSLVSIVATNAITITFDNTNYPTNGVNRVGIELWADTNSIAFATATITNATAPTIYTNKPTSLFFRRTTTNLWYGRQ